MHILTIRTKQDLINRYTEQSEMFPLMKTYISLQRYLKVNWPYVQQNLKREAKQNLKREAKRGAK